MQTFNDYLELASQLALSGNHLITVRGQKITKEKLLELQQKSDNNEQKFFANVEAIVGGNLNTKDIELIKRFIA